MFCEVVVECLIFFFMLYDILFALQRETLGFNEKVSTFFLQYLIILILKNNVWVFKSSFLCAYYYFWFFVFVWKITILLLYNNYTSTQMIYYTTDRYWFFVLNGLMFLVWIIKKKML